MPDHSADVLVLGCGYAGSAVARLARENGLSVVATVRSEERAAKLRADNFSVLALPTLAYEAIAPYLGQGSSASRVVVCFPPDGETDQALAPKLAARAKSIAYVSSTSVYGDRRGVVDDTTPVADPPPARAVRLLAAEDAWRAAGATVLRCPAIYGPDRGLHVRITSGQHRIPGDGSNVVSRIHVADLATLIVATWTHPVRGETFVVGDRSPASQREIASFIAAEYGVPMPPSVPIDEVHETLRGDRAVDPSRALAVLGVSLAYPHYRDGMARAAPPSPSRAS